MDKSISISNSKEGFKHLCDATMKIADNVLDSAKKEINDYLKEQLKLFTDIIDESQYRYESNQMLTEENINLRQTIKELQQQIKNTSR